MSLIKSFDNAYADAIRKDWSYIYVFLDLHSTLIKPNYSAGNIPTEFYKGALEGLRIMSAAQDIKIIMYTCSHPHEIEQYEKMFSRYGIKFDFINENPEVTTTPQGYGCYDKKPYFNILIDDKASFNPETEWEDIINYLNDRNSPSTINSRNEKLFNRFKRQHVSEGGQMPREVGLTNLIADALKRHAYKLYLGGGCDTDGKPIRKYDVVLWLGVSNDPYFMVALDIDEGNHCGLYRCNDKGNIEKKLI
jgi:hypothetical protein